MSLRVGTNRWTPRMMPPWLRKRLHRHLMTNFSSGSTRRYCVAGLWDSARNEMIRCPYTDEKAR